MKTTCVKEKIINMKLGFLVLNTRMMSQFQIVEDFLTTFCFVIVLLILSLKFASNFSAICFLPEELSAHSFVD